MINVIPIVNEYEDLNNKIHFSNYQIIIKNKFIKAVSLFNEELERKLHIDENAIQYTFEFQLEKEFKNDEYSIEMQDNNTFILGGGELAFYYATRTLSQLFMLNTRGVSLKIESKAYYIHDYPTYKFRSLMIDESSHFFGVEEIKKIIDVMSDLKMNYLHWHLFDDYGIRLSLQRFENFKLIGSTRSKDLINVNKYDNNEYRHYYHYHEIKDIINYANKRYIELIPEIALPSHCEALLASYSFLSCDNKKHDVKVDYSIPNSIICASNKKSYDFLYSLLDEICLLFKDSKYIHLGGNEADYSSYVTCKSCNALMKENGLNDYRDLQSYFENNLINYLKKYNKKVILFNDGINKLTSKDAMMQYWCNDLNNKEIKDINKGRITVYSPFFQFLFNEPYSVIPLDITYKGYINNININKEAIENIIGIEGIIKTEWINSCCELEIHLNPRIEALAEASWSNIKNKNFDSFVKRMEQFYPYLDYKSVSYMSINQSLVSNLKDREKINNEYITNKHIELYLHNTEKKER